MFSTKPIKINGCEYSDLKILGLSNQDQITISIIKIANGNAIEITRTGPILRNSFPADTNENEIYHTLCLGCFQNIKCEFCGNEYSALMISETDGGHICIGCIEETHPRLQFEPIAEIERYVKNKRCTEKKN